MVSVCPEEVAMLTFEMLSVRYMYNVTMSVRLF